MTLRRVPVQGACPGVEQVSQYSKHTGCGLIGAGPAKATSCRGQPAMQPGSRPVSQPEADDGQAALEAAGECAGEAGGRPKFRRVQAKNWL